MAGESMYALRWKIRWAVICEIPKRRSPIESVKSVSRPRGRLGHGGNDLGRGSPSQAILPVSCFGLRISSLFRISTFGFRISSLHGFSGEIASIAVAGDDFPAEGILISHGGRSSLMERGSPPCRVVGGKQALSESV